METTKIALVTSGSDQPILFSSSWMVGNSQISRDSSCRTTMPRGNEVQDVEATLTLGGRWSIEVRREGPI
jgi:hypothetical protein